MAMGNVLIEGLRPGGVVSLEEPSTISPPAGLMTVVIQGGIISLIIQGWESCIISILKASLPPYIFGDEKHFSMGRRCQQEEAGGISTGDFVRLFGYRQHKKWRVDYLIRNWLIRCK